MPLMCHTRARSSSPHHSLGLVRAPMLQTWTRGLGAAGAEGHACLSSRVRTLATHGESDARARSSFLRAWGQRLSPLGLWERVPGDSLQLDGGRC